MLAGPFRCHLGLAACVFAACGGDHPDDPLTPTPPVASAMAIAGGNGQQGQTGAILTEPLTVRITDAMGAGVAGVPVSWALVSGEGDFWAGALIGDGSGRLPFPRRRTRLARCPSMRAGERHLRARAGRGSHRAPV